jgi:multisubunit Na+/H+ antiporter MnhB subunit
MLGFVTGISVGSSLVVFALASGRDRAHWSLVKRHLVIEQLARLSLAVFVAACGISFAYLGFLLA